MLRYISYALILPLATIVGANIFRESVTVYTGVGLATVVFGFGLYQKFHAMAGFSSSSSSSSSGSVARWRRAGDSM